MVFSTTTAELLGDNRNRHQPQHHRHASYSFELAGTSTSVCRIDDQTMDVLHAMLRQEADYLPSRRLPPHGSYCSRTSNCNSHDPAFTTPTRTRTTHPNTAAASIHPDDRRKLVRWGIQVMDFCNLDRCLVEVAMNYTDRYVSCPSSRHVQWTRASYQLVAMTSVYIAVKLYSCEAMDPQLVSDKLSRQTYTVAEIEAQERRILHGLHWKLNPPTAASFLANYMDILFRCGLLLQVPLSQQANVYDCAVEQILSRVEQIHHHDHHHTSVRPSTMALEALRDGLLRCCCYCCSAGGSSRIDPAQVEWALLLLPQHRPPRPRSAPTSPKQQTPRMLRDTASPTCPALAYSLSEDDDDDEQLLDVQHNDDHPYFGTATNQASSSSPRCVMQQHSLAWIPPSLFLQHQQPSTLLSTTGAADEDDGMLLQ